MTVKHLKLNLIFYGKARSQILNSLQLGTLQFDYYYTITNTLHLSIYNTSMNSFNPSKPQALAFQNI
jgi:hypothetical protein